MTRNSKGFTLIELMVGMIVTGIMGVALTQMLINNSRFVAQTEAMINARQAARAALNLLGAELAMVSDSGPTPARATRTHHRGAPAPADHLEHKLR